MVLRLIHGRATPGKYVADDREYGGVLLLQGSGREAIRFPMGDDTAGLTFLNRGTGLSVPAGIMLVWRGGGFRLVPS